MILSFDDYETQARLLAEVLDMPCHLVRRHRFPDGENKLTLPVELPEHVIFCRTLDHPNEKLLELLLAVKTARQLGVSELTLVTPYLCYMRQDKAFVAGEAVSQQIVGKFLAELFDNVITVDPHLHRIQYLEQAVPAARAVALSATALMADFLCNHVEDPVLLGPDAEAEQWVSSVASPGHWTYGVSNKQRLGDREVKIALPDINLNQRCVVLVDDVASSGQTLVTAAKACLARKARHVDVLVTHALYSSEVKQQLLQAGVRFMWSTDSVSHESNAICLNRLLGDAVTDLLKH